MEPIRKEQTFPATGASVAKARRFVADVLEGVVDKASVVELLTSELAANAVIHADSEFRVRVIVNVGTVRVEIVNDEPELLLIMKEPSDEGGRGLHIVKALAQDWGSESRRDEKVVWFAVSTGAAADDASVDA
jgi:anti-sigma regulatory factor (Ser/Thr protein kinase)